jgi:hypothetical protein
MCGLVFLELAASNVEGVYNVSAILAVAIFGIVTLEKGFLQLLYIFLMRKLRDSCQNLSKSY